jgi:hypothetical protein
MAAATRNQTSIEGGLYELVARGVKDQYFMKDEKDAVHPFQWTYNRWPASLPESRNTNPLNQPRWGGRCEFEFDLPGDVLMDAKLLIELPTWLPPPLARGNYTHDTFEAGTNGVPGVPPCYYGWVRGIAYFLFEKIEIYQDAILLQEVSGDSLYFAGRTKSSYNQGFLTQKLAGDHDGSDYAIMRNATPGIVFLPLPMIGCSFPGDKGLPLCGLRHQTFRLRLTLRSPEQLVECSYPTIRSPAPWKKSFTQLGDMGDPITMPALELSELKPPSIVLQTRQLYLLNEAREQLEKETIEVPYIRYFDNIFTANQLDYAPLEKGGTAYLVKFLDAVYTVERIFTFFRNSTELAANRRWNTTNTGNVAGDFYSSLQLTIAGQQREGLWGPSIWELVIPHAKEERYGQTHLPLFNWSRGWRIEDTPPALREPTGGINFTTADRPMLTFTLTDVLQDPVLRYKLSEFTSCGESWALYKIKKGRGGLEYAN